MEKDLILKNNDVHEDSLIELKNLSFSYDDKNLVLDNINLKINSGENIALIGTNGSGKSTLARIIDGILKEKSGEIYIKNELMTNKNVNKLRKNIALIFQNPDSQFIGDTVKDDIAFSLENMCVEPSIMEDIIISSLKEIRMEKYIDFSPKNLSGGQKEKIALASSIARNASILILDEAYAMLDPKSKNEMKNLIKKRKENNKGLTIINITHELEDIVDVDRVIVLDKGRIVMDDTPKNVFLKSDELKNIGLDVPFLNNLILELNDKGLNYTLDLSSDELVKKICQ